MKIFTINIRTIIWGLGLMCGVLVVAVFLVGSNVFGATPPGRDNLPIYRVGLAENDKRIAITFDNAWGADDIPDILNSLEKYNAKATFFVLGTWAEKFPDVVKNISDAGHEIANHSYAHHHPTKLNAQELANEINKCNEAIKNVTGKDCNIYRAPYGEYNDFVVKGARDNGMYIIQWDVDSLDWKSEMTAKAIYQRIVGKVKPGSIVLFHNDTEHTKEILPEILEKLTADGYKSVTVSELIYMENYTIDNQGEQKQVK